MAGKTTLGKPIQWKNLTRSLSIWQAPCHPPIQPGGDARDCAETG
jgi:hypothetical protein